LAAFSFVPVAEACGQLLEALPRVDLDVRNFLPPWGYYTPEEHIRKSSQGAGARKELTGYRKDESSVGIGADETDSSRRRASLETQAFN
jgi:hypothetical protein